MTQASAPQQPESTYLGNVYCAASGQWAFRLFRDGEEIARGAGFDDECEAAEACLSQVLDADLTVYMVADPDFDFSADSSEGVL